MKKKILFVYSFLAWLVVLLLALLAFILFSLESPSSILKLLEAPLKKEGITYSKMEGSLLTGFTISDVNYQNKAKAKELTLKVDLHQLQNRVLQIDKLVMTELEIEKSFLASLIDTNSTETNASDENSSLPFDKVIIGHANISLKEIDYDAYKIHSLELILDDVESDMKEKHQGKVSLKANTNAGKIDLKAKLKDNAYTLLADIEGESSFLAPFVQEQNLSLLSNPKFHLALHGDFDKLNYKLKTKALDLAYTPYTVHAKRLDLEGSYALKKQDIVAHLKSDLNANVANIELRSDVKLNLNDLNNTLAFNFDAQLDPKKQLLQAKVLHSVLNEQNISIQKLPSIKLFAKGSMKKADFNAKIKALKITQNDIILNLQNFDIKGTSKPLQGDVNFKANTNFDSNILDAKIALSSKLNFYDINNSLSFNCDAQLHPREQLLKQTEIASLLKEQNITVQQLPSIKLFAKGSMKKVDFNANLQALEAKQNDIKLSLKNFDIQGRTNPLQGDTDFKANTNFDSSIADGTIALESKLNFHDINNSLNFKVDSQLLAHESYLNPLVKESNLTLTGDSLVKLNAHGNMNDITAKLDIETEVLKDNIRSKIVLHTSPIFLNLKTNQIEGSLSLNSDAKNLALNIKSNFSGNYLKPKELQSSSSVQVKSFNAFNLDLSQFAPLTLQIDSSSQGAKANISSKKLKLQVQSTDYDHVKFSMKSQKIYLDQITKLPPELKGKFVKLNLKGSATLSKQYFSLEGDIQSNKNFKAKLNAYVNETGLNASIIGKHYSIEAKGDLKSKNIKAKVKISSLKKVQKEFQALYPFEPVPVDGKLNLNAHLQAEEITASLSSPKLKFNGFSFEKLALNAHYDKELLTLSKFSFNTRGFKHKSLNKSYYLNQEARIYLGKRRDVFIDMHPKIKITAKGDSRKLKATVQIESLPLGHNDYGDTELSCDIDYVQNGNKKNIKGGIFLDKLNIFYESKFIDPSFDNDVIVISKKDKNKKEDKANFINDTAIDLAIYASEARYKTRDIDLAFTLNAKAKKKFGKSLRMLGKVEEINGRVEQAPKLFTVVDSNIVFRGAKEINPLLDLTVQYELPDVLITISIHGNAKRPKLNFSSNPPLPKKDILSYLLLGVSTASLGEGKGSLGREAELFIMNQAARDLAYEVELDRVFIKDDGTGEGYAVQIGKKVNEDTMVILENSKEGNSFIIEYDVSKNIKIEVGQHQKTMPSQSIDVYFRKRFR